MKKMINILLAASMLASSTAVPFMANAAEQQTVTVQTAESEEKPIISEKLKQDIDAGLEKIDVLIRCTFKIDYSKIHPEVDKATQEYAETLDTSVYSEEEINEMVGAFKIDFYNKMYQEAYAVKTKEVCDFIGIDVSEANFIGTALKCSLTPEQIYKIAGTDLVKGRVIEQCEYVSAEDLGYHEVEATDSKAEDAKKAMEILNAYFKENNMDAKCVTSEEYPSYYPPLVIEYVAETVTGKQIMEFVENNNIDKTLFEVVPIINGQKTYWVYDTVNIKGDANCDSQVDMADAVLIMQALANPNKYGINGTAEHHLTEQGKLNGDMNGDGLTVGDAQAIQRKLLGLDSDDNHSKPLPTQRIVLNCQSSCALDETLKIDVAMGDMYSYQQEHNGYPTYDTPGHAEYGIYACDSVNYSKIDNENLIINGENSEFKKVYSKEEMKSLDISGQADDYDSYHHETAEIDFSNFQTGDSGNIVVYFQWEYDEENPYNPSSKISGMSKIVGYYVGEKGVAIGADAEDAQSRYQAIFDSLSNEDNVIRFGYYDEDYNKPLPSARIALKCDSFCPIGEKLTVDVAKGDGAFHPQDYDSDRIYEYSIYPSENFNAITDEKLIVNGENGNYKKEYVGEEMQVFDIDGKYTDYDAYNHETAVIDFKNYEVGSSGCITFSFKAIFSNSSTSGMMQNMYFYVGEKGVSISNTGIENAIEDYQATYGSTENNDNDILFGYYDANYSKPLPSARIALKCDSLCPLGEKLTVDVAKGDGAFHPQDYDSDRIYEYSIYPSENFNPINDEKLIVNGENGSYKKEYVGEEMQVFDIDGKYTGYDAYNHEKAVIDFKNYEVGSSGCITFAFKAIFSNSSTSGMMQNMYFYVGEKGISISNIDVENAIENYQSAYGSVN